MHLFPKINYAFVVALTILPFVAALNILILLWKLLFKRYFPSIVKVIWGVVNIIFTVAILVYLYTSLLPLVYDWETVITQYGEVSVLFGLSLLLINTLYLLSVQSILFERTLLVLSSLFLGITLYYFITTQPYEEQEEIMFAMEPDLLRHTPLANFIISAAVSLYFILFVGFRRRWRL